MKYMTEDFFPRTHLATIFHKRFGVLDDLIPTGLRSFTGGMSAFLIKLPCEFDAIELRFYMYGDCKHVRRRRDIYRDRSYVFYADAKRFVFVENCSVMRSSTYSKILKDDYDIYLDAHDGKYVLEFERNDKFDVRSVAYECVDGFWHQGEAHPANEAYGYRVDNSIIVPHQLVYKKINSIVWSKLINQYSEGRMWRNGKLLKSYRGRTDDLINYAASIATEMKVKHTERMVQ